MKRFMIFAFCSILILTIVCAVHTQVPAEESFQATEIMEFSSVEELVDYLSNDNGTMTLSLFSNTLYVPKEANIAENFGADLQGVEVAGDNYYYVFKVSDTDVGIAAASLDADLMEDVVGEGISTEDIAQACVEDFVIGWFRDSDGEAVLNSLAAPNPLDYWEEHPGYYYTTSPFSDMVDPLGYMIYWVQDGEFFQASVPADKLETFWENVDNLMETISY